MIGTNNTTPASSSVGVGSSPHPPYGVSSSPNNPLIQPTNETMQAPSAFAPLPSRRKISGPPSYTGTINTDNSSLGISTGVAQYLPTKNEVTNPPPPPSSSSPPLPDKNISVIDKEWIVSNNSSTINHRNGTIHENSSSFTDYSSKKLSNKDYKNVSPSSSSSPMQPSSKNNNNNEYGNNNPASPSTVSVIPNSSRDRTESSTSVTIELVDPPPLDFPAVLPTSSSTQSPKQNHHHQHQHQHQHISTAKGDYSNTTNTHPITSVSPIESIDPLSSGGYVSPSNQKQKNRNYNGNPVNGSGTKISMVMTTNTATGSSNTNNASSNRRKNNTSATPSNNTNLSSPIASQSGNGRRSPWYGNHQNTTTTNNTVTSPSPSFMMSPTLSTGALAASYGYTQTPTFMGRQRGDSGVVDAWFANGLSGPLTPSSNTVYVTNGNNTATNNNNGNNGIPSRIPQVLTTASPFTDTDMSHLVRGVENVTASPVHIFTPFSPPLPMNLSMQTLHSQDSHENPNNSNNNNIVKMRKLIVSHAPDGGFSADLENVNEDPGGMHMGVDPSSHRSNENPSRQGNNVNGGTHSGSVSAAVSPFPNLDQVSLSRDSTAGLTGSNGSTNHSGAPSHNYTKRPSKNNNGRNNSNHTINNGNGRNSAEDKYLFHRPSSVTGKLREILTDDSPESIPNDKYSHPKYDEEYSTPSFTDGNNTKDEDNSNGNLWKQRQLTSSPPRFRTYSTDMNPIPEHNNQGAISPIPVEGEEEIAYPIITNDGPKRPSALSQPSDGWTTFGTSTTSNMVRDNNTGHKDTSTRNATNNNNNHATSKTGRQTPQSPSRIASPSSRVSPRRTNKGTNNNLNAAGVVNFNYAGNGGSSNPLASPVGKSLPSSSSLVSPPPTHHYHPSQPQQSFHQVHANNNAGKQTQPPPLPHPGVTGMTNSAFIVPSPVRQFSDSQTPNIYRLPQTLAARARAGNFTLPTVKEVGNNPPGMETNGLSNLPVTNLSRNYSPIKGFNEFMKNENNGGGDNASMQWDNVPRQYMGNDEESSLPASGPASTNVSAPGSPSRTTHASVQQHSQIHPMNQIQHSIPGTTGMNNNNANTLQNYPYSIPNGHISPLPIAMAFGQNGELVSYSPVNFAMISSSLPNMNNIPSNPSPPLISNGYNGTVSPPPQLMNMQNTYGPSSMVEGMQENGVGWMNNNGMLTNSLMYSNTNSMWNTNITNMVNSNTVRNTSTGNAVPSGGTIMHPSFSLPNGTVNAASLYSMYSTNPTGTMQGSLGSNHLTGPMNHGSYNVYPNHPNNGSVSNGMPYGNNSHHHYVAPYGPYGMNNGQTSNGIGTLSNNLPSSNPNTNLHYINNGMTLPGGVSLLTTNNLSGGINNGSSMVMNSHGYRSITPSVDVGLSAESPAWMPHVKPSTMNELNNSQYNPAPSSSNYPTEDNRSMNNVSRRNQTVSKENSTGVTANDSDDYYSNRQSSKNSKANANPSLANNKLINQRTKDKPETHTTGPNGKAIVSNTNSNRNNTSSITNNNNNTNTSNHHHSTLNTSMSSVSTVSSKASITSNGISMQDVLKSATTARRNGDTAEARRILENLTRESKGMRDPAVWIELFRLYDENSVSYSSVIRPAMERAVTSALRTLTTSLHNTNSGSVPEETLGLKLIHIAGRNRDSTFLQSMVDTAMNNVNNHNNHDNSGNPNNKNGNFPIMRYSAQHIWRILAQIANIEAKWNRLEFAFHILGIYAPGFVESLTKLSSSNILTNTPIDINAFVVPLSNNNNASNTAVPAWAGPAILEIVAFIEKWQSLRMAIESCRMAISIFPRYGPLAFATLRYLEMQAHNDICTKLSHLANINHDIEASMYDVLRNLCANVPNESTETNDVSSWKLIILSKLFRHHILLPRILPSMDMYEILNTLSAYVPHYLSERTNVGTAATTDKGSLSRTNNVPPIFAQQQQSLNVIRENRRFSMSGFPEDTTGSEWQSPKYISTYKTKYTDTHGGQDDILYDIRHGPNVSMSDFETKKRNDHFDLNVSTLNAGTSTAMVRNNAPASESAGPTALKDNLLDLSAISLESSSILPDLEDPLDHEFADLQEKLVNLSVQSIPNENGSLPPNVSVPIPVSSVGNETFIIEMVEAGRKAERVLGHLLLNIDTIASAVPQLSAYMQVANDAARYITKESLSRLHIEICGTYTRAHMICAALTKELLIYRYITKLLLAQVDNAVLIVYHENNKPSSSVSLSLQEYLNFTPLHSAAGVIGKIDNVLKDISINQANKLQQGINTELDTVLSICHPGQRWRSYLSRVRTTLHTAILTDILRVYGTSSSLGIFMDKFIYTASSKLSASYSISSSSLSSGSATLNSSFMQTVISNAFSPSASTASLPSLWKMVEGSLSPFLKCGPHETETIRTALEQATQSANESVRPFVYIEAGRYAEISGRIDDARKYYGIAIDSITNEPASPEGDSNLSPVPANTINVKNKGKDNGTGNGSPRSSRSAANDWKVWQSSALCELRTGNPRGAMQLCTQALTLVPGSGRIWALAAQIQMHIADTLFPLANDVSFTDPESIEKYPDHPPFTPLASSAGFNLRSVEQSNIRALIHTARVVRMAVAHTPKSGEVWIEAGRIHANPLGPFFDLPAAHACFDRAAELTSQCGDVFVEATRSILVRNIIASLPGSFTATQSSIHKFIKDISIDKLLQDNHLLDILNEAIRTEPNYGSCWISKSTWCTYETRERTQQIIYRIRDNILQQYLGYEYSSKSIVPNHGNHGTGSTVSKYDHRLSTGGGGTDDVNNLRNNSTVTEGIQAYLQATYMDKYSNTKDLPIWHSTDIEKFLTLPEDSSTFSSYSSTINRSSSVPLTIFLPSLYMSMGFVRTVALMTLPPTTIFPVPTVTTATEGTVLSSYKSINEISPNKYYRVQSPMDRLQILYGGDSF